MEDELENYKTKCRLCLQRLDRGAVNISDDSSATNDFFRLTNLKVVSQFNNNYKFFILKINFSY